MTRLPSLLHPIVAIALCLLCAAVSGQISIADPPMVKLPSVEIAKENEKASAMTALAFSGDSKLLAVGYETGRIRLYDIPNKQWLRWLDVKHTQGVVSLAVSPDGSLVASCENGPAVTVSSRQTGHVVETAKFDSEGIQTVTFTPDGHELVGGGGNVYFWSVPDMKLSRTMEIPHGAAYIAVASGRLAVENDQCGVWDIETGKNIFSHELTHGSGPVALSPDGKFVISASGFWDVDGHKNLGDMYVQQGCFGFASSGDYAVGGSEEDGVYVWDGHTGATLASTEFGVNLSALSHDGKTLAVADSENGLTLVTIEMDKIRAVAYKKAHPSARELANVALINAVLKGDAAGVQTALQDGANPNSIVDEHGPPLWECASTDRIDIFKLLIKAGALIRAKDGGARLDILSMSITSHGSKILAYLAAHGEKINQINGPYLVSSAVKSGGEDAVRFLLSHGVPIDSLYDDKTALMTAAKESKPEMVGLLLKLGASTKKLSTKDHLNAYQYALESANPASVRLLLNTAPNCDPVFPDGTTAAICAVRTHDPELLEMLIKRGVNINKHGAEWFSTTPLITAVDDSHTSNVSKNSAACVRILLAHGAKVNAKDDRGFTALDLCGDPESEQLLRKYGGTKTHEF